MNSRQITFKQLQNLIEEYTKENPVIQEIESGEDPFDAIEDIFRQRDNKVVHKDNVIPFPLHRVKP